MNKWTILSIVVLIGILSISLWMITQSQDPLLEAESAAEQEIGVEEFENGTADSPLAADDTETIIEPDLALDDGADGEEQPAQPTDPADPDPAEPVLPGDATD